MANDFSSDGSCKALWRFESGALTTDSKSTNTLTNSGVSEETTNHMEGSCGALFESANSDYMNIPDANLASGFPLKSGDTTKIATFAFWFRAATVPGSGAYAGLVTKWDWTNSKISISILLTNGKLRVSWGYGSGTSNEYFDTATISANTKYHVVVTFDGANKQLYLWVYNLSTAVLSSYSKTWSNALRIVDCDYRVGAECNGNYFNGVIDEVVVLNRMVNEIEAVKIRAGTYTGASQLDVAAVHAYIEYIEAGEILVPHVAAEVEWVPTDPNTHLYSGNIPIVITPSAVTDPEWQYAGNLSAVIGVAASEYFYTPPGHFEYHGDINISIAPSALYALGFVFNSVGVPIGIAVGGDYMFPDRFYEGNILIEILVEGKGVLPIPGWDKYTGYGLTELDDLSGPPPFWCVGDDADQTFPMGINVEADYALYAEYSYEATGALEVGGEFGIEVFDPLASTVIMSGGVKAGGTMEPTTAEPWRYNYHLRGGVNVGGELGISYVDASDLPITTVTFRKGVEAGGSFGFEFMGVEELITQIELSGGAKVGEIRRAPITFITPVTDETIYVLETRGTVWVGGSFEIDAPEPGVYQHTLTRAQLKVGGACVFGFWEPPVITLEFEGGVIVEGEAITGEDSRFETWVLNGFYFEPTIYGNFPFNSYAVRGGDYFAAGPDGIYVLDGTTDEGRPIHPGVRIGPANFGVNNKKRLRAIYPGNAGTPELRVVGIPKGEDSFCKLDDRGRFSVNQKVQDEIMVMEISDFDRLAQIEFVPVILAKK